VLYLQVEIEHFVTECDADAAPLLDKSALLTLCLFCFPTAGVHVCRHTSRFLLCHIHFLPLLLWPLAGWDSPALAVLIAFLVLNIEGIASYIEEPFHVSFSLPQKERQKAAKPLQKRDFALATSDAPLVMHARPVHTRNCSGTAAAVLTRALQRRFLIQRCFPCVAACV
jgi:hypothetical protein